MCFKYITNCVTNMLILALLWPDALVQRVFFAMQAYLSNIWRLSFTHAAGIVNVWEGTSLVLPVLFQFLADQLFGNFGVVVICSISSTVGIGLVALSVPRMLANSEGMCNKLQQECVDDTHRVLFYIGMVLTAVGRAGLSVSVDALHDEQSHQNDCLKFFRNIISDVEKLFLYQIGSLIIIIFVKRWTLIFGIPAIYSAYITSCFFCCWKAYKKPGAKPKGSPITNVCRVFTAAASSKKKSQPSSLPNHDATHQKPSSSSRFPRCLDKALTVSAEEEDDQKKKISQEDVDVAKYVVRMALISITFIICGIVSSLGNTYFVEQANHMNRRLGKWNVPLLVFQLPMICARYIHEHLNLTLIFKMKDCVKSISGIDVSIVSLRTTCASMLYSVLCCITAAKIEEWRLKSVSDHGSPIHAAWLIIQFFLLGGVDANFRKSINEFYSDKASQDMKDYRWDDPTMKNYLPVATNLVSGLGFMFSVVSVYAVGKISESGGRKGWFQDTLNESRLDRYYWFLAALSSVHLIVFILVAPLYAQNKPEKSQDHQESGGNANFRQQPASCFG